VSSQSNCTYRWSRWSRTSRNEQRSQYRDQGSVEEISRRRREAGKLRSASESSWKLSLRCAMCTPSCPWSRSFLHAVNESDRLWLRLLPISNC
jgi:heterodisulfide reductase subunit C